SLCYSEQKQENSMTQSTIIRSYFQGLESGSYEKVIQLFAPNAVVLSPLYGKKSATTFYKELFSDTNRSKITLKNIFVNPDNSQVAAGHFLYDWTLKDGTKAPFECIDVFEFTKDNKFIEKLTIIYDTQHTRKAFEQIHQK